MKRLLITLAVLSTLALLPKLALANNFIPLRAGPVTMVFDTDILIAKRRVQNMDLNVFGLHLLRPVLWEHFPQTIA